MLSVIIPSYNYGRYLVDAVRSVDGADEIIVVDDASTDDTEPFIRSLRHIKYIKLDKNVGMAAARNEGLKHSKNSFILFLDADDMRVSGSVKLQFDYFVEHPEVQVVWGNALEIRGDITYPEAEAGRDKWRVHPAEVNPQTVMYRREVFEKFGGFYEGLRSGTDKEMCMRLGLHPESPFKTLKCKKLKAPLAYYRKHEGQIHKLRKADEAWAKETKRVQKERIKQLKKEGITRGNTRFPI